MPIHPDPLPCDTMPDFSLETEFWHRGSEYVAGVDEAGRGCLAGPVVAAAVILREDAHLPNLDDSKRLKENVREELFPQIRDQAIAIGLGQCMPEEIDRLNILWAAMEAMRRAIEDLSLSPDCVLVDGDREIPDCPCPQRTVIGGDGLCMSVAAASVVAKVTRDRLMARLDLEYPQYGFVNHKGYATTHHYSALATHGPTPHHRRSFRLA